MSPVYAHLLRTGLMGGIASLFICTVLLGGCHPGTGTPPVSASPTPDQSAIWRAWQSGPHAHTYDLGKGPNTYCARCHSPRNWNPAATIDPPPNCVSCKFPSESTPRSAKGNPLVAQADWKNIGCEICHLVSDGHVEPDIMWLDVVTGYHETVTSTTALCEKCHTDTPAIRHKRTMTGGAHLGFTCTTCHDPHSTRASCTTAACHPTVLSAPSAIPGHDRAHASVACVACHDAAGLQVGPQPDGRWITWRTTELLGQKSTAPYQSHSIQRVVDCTRCHYPQNPWGLSEQRKR